MRILFFAVVLATYSHLVLAEAQPFKTGNDLHYAYMEIGKANAGRAHDAAAITYFLGYLTGMAQLLQVNAYRKQQPAICNGTEIAGGQMADVVGKFLSDYPERRGEGATQLTLAALLKAFPCPSNTSDKRPVRQQ